MKEQQVKNFLRTARKSTAWGVAIHKHLDDGKDINLLLSKLREQYKDNPKIMVSVFCKAFADLII